MPCDSIILNRVDMPVMNDELLALALKAMGAIGTTTAFMYQGQRYTLQNGKLVGRDASVADVLKQAYSTEVVKYTARKQGWQVKLVGRNKYQIIKR